MKYTIMLEKGEYSLIDRGDKMKEYAVVNGLNKETGTWAWTCAYWAYEYDGMMLDNVTSALSCAIDYFRMRTEDNYITRARLEELATLFKDGLIEDNEYEAMIYFNETCDMGDYEKEFFGIEEEA